MAKPPVTEPELARIGPPAPEIQSAILPFRSLIETRKKGFVGRRFLFDELTAFMKEKSNGYFILQGDPGFGKTTFLANLIDRYEGSRVYHFNSRAEGTTRQSQFLKNICAQLIDECGLNRQFLPADTEKDNTVFINLLEEAASRVARPILLVIDALDEVDRKDRTMGNILGLPRILPDNIFVALTSRPGKMPITTESPRCDHSIDQTDTHHMEDIREYIRQRSQNPRMETFLAEKRYSCDQFLEIMTDKSQGNFMYLFHVFNDMEDGRLQDLTIDKLPSGLEDYYEIHWRIMKGNAPDQWSRVLAALAVAQEPLSLADITRFSKLDSHSRTAGILIQWEQFLHMIETPVEGRLVKHYRIYHRSFQDFLEDKDQIEGELLDLAQSHRSIGRAQYDDYQAYKHRERSKPG